MTDSQTSLVLAIDGGGTRCRVAVSDGARTAVVETGSANVSTDFEAAVASMISALPSLAQKTGTSVEAVTAAPAFVGLAGVTGADMVARLQAALPFRRAIYADDRPAALRGALGRADGVVAHCGTGSFLAAQFGGVSRFAGGWGPVLGDEASAQWVGRKALALTLRQADGHFAPSDLADHLIGRFGGTSGIVKFAGQAGPKELGALAPLVTGHAQEGDPLALQVMRAAVDYVSQACTLMGWVPGAAICLTGGIGPLYAPYLPEDMRADVTPPAGTPLDGALALAREHQTEAADGRC